MRNVIGRLRNQFHDGRAALFPKGAETAFFAELMKKHSDLADGIVQEIYKYSCEAVGPESPRSRHAGLSIVATGGYGRQELSPFSDIDIAFVLSEEQDAWVEAIVHSAFKLVMDVFLSFREIRVGYSYRPVSEAATWDLATKTALLDARHLCGNPFLTEALGIELRRNLSPLDLSLELQRESWRGGTGRGHSVYSVEPNLKEGPGALRDLHRGRWILELLLGVDRQQLEPALLRLAGMSAATLQEIHRAAEWFWRARNWLHLVARKRSEVLMNNYQDRIARELGDLSAQEWFAVHYTHAESLVRFREFAVRKTFEGPVDIEELRLQAGYLHTKAVLGPSGSSAVGLFHLSQRYSIPISSRDITMLAESRSAAVKDKDVTANECWSFLSILNEGRDVARTLRALARYGYLDRFVPRFSELMRFIPPDPTHRYTVGEHSFRVIEELEALRSNPDPRSSRFADLMHQCSHHDVLCLAALVHDAGKIIPDVPHSETGTRIAMDIADRLELAPEKRELLEILVLHHLLLVRTGRLEDLQSPAVIENVAQKLPSLDALRHLYVFTYVDTQSVAERNWTSMDYRDLEELYRRVSSMLAGESAEVESSAALESRIGQIRRRLAASNNPQDEAPVREHCDAMPASYVLNTPLDEITLHIELIGRLEQERVVVDIYNRPGDDYSELTVCSYDDPQPGLLAKLAGVLYGCGADIHKAQVHTMERERPLVLDTLWIRSSGMQISEHRAKKVRSALTEVLSGAKTVDAYLSSIGKHPPKSISLESVELRNDLSEERTVVHIVARDLQGLLYLITRTLSRNGLSVHSARVATWAGKAENNFYVTTLTGGQIPNEELSQWSDHITRLLKGMDVE